MFSSVSQHHFFQLFFQLSPICCLTISAPSSLFNCSSDSRSWVSVLLCFPDATWSTTSLLQSSVELVWCSDSHVWSILWARISSLFYLMQRHRRRIDVRFVLLHLRYVPQLSSLLVILGFDVQQIGSILHLFLLFLSLDRVPRIFSRGSSISHHLFNYDFLRL